MGEIADDFFRLRSIFQFQFPQTLAQKGNEFGIAAQRQDVIPRSGACANKTGVRPLAGRLGTITGARENGRPRIVSG